MDEKAKLLKRLEVIERPSVTFNSQIKSERRDHFVPVSRPLLLCRFFIHPTRILGQNNSLGLLESDRAPPPTPSVIHPIREEHHQESCCTNTQERSSQETTHQMLETATQTKTKSMEMDIKESKIPHLQTEQSLFRRAIRFLIILFIILGVFYIIVIGSQASYGVMGGIARSWNLLIQKWRFTGRFNPPI